MKAQIILSLLLVSTGITSLSQSLAPRGCATMEQDSVNRARFPKRGTLDEFEEVLQKKIREMHARRGPTMQGTLLTIPIIVHIVHNGEPVGSGLNISQAQVQSQIQVLNEDFRKLLGTPGYNTHPAGADIEIEFCLSPVDYNGVAMTEPGIHRYNGNKSSWTRNEIENQLKPITIWNPNLFYNVWTLRFGGGDASLLGYAQFPDQSGLQGLNEVGGPASTDGSVVQFNTVGSGFPNQLPLHNQGRILSHETGHWLGLRHIWGDGPCASDFVSDTPAVLSPSNGCPSGRLACDGVTPAMIQNYMDYSDDACMNIFTNGQKTRMMAVMEFSPRRKSLIDANLCSPVVTDVPTANFTSDKQLVLLGGQIRFTDLSTNFPTAWEWTFEGGDPNTSTLRNPNVKYNIPGVYGVSLRATNSLGSSAPLELIGYVTVSEEGLCSEVTNFLPMHTESVLPMSDFGPYTGYLAGHNSTAAKGVAEFFANQQGYEYVSGVKIKFGYLASPSEGAMLTVVVWNARGSQNGPGSVVERKSILLKQIEDDILAGQPTHIVFDRETPVFSKAYHVGIELEYTSGVTTAIVSSANGESTESTSWVQSAGGTWSPFATTFGANVALAITSIVGVNPSVQIAASKLLVAPNETVTLNARGASVFVWNSSDGAVVNFPGPQLIVQPQGTTVYTATGSGLDLCNSVASSKIFTSEVITQIEEKNDELTLYPNPGTSKLNLMIGNAYRGAVRIELMTTTGLPVLLPFVAEKSAGSLVVELDTGDLAQGLYIVEITVENRRILRKWLKN